MAKTTVLAIYDQARSLLGDDQIAGGEIFSNAVLLPHYSKAYRALYRMMASLGNPYIERDTFFILPANTNFLDPVTAGVTDMGEPLFVEYRIGFTSVNIAGVSGFGTVLVNAIAHGFSTGDQVTISNAGGWPETDGMWGITVLDANNFFLNGCVGSGAGYLGNGVAVKGTGRFLEMKLTDRFDDLGTSVNDYRYAWLQDTLHFRPNTLPIQLRITYLASGNPPISTGSPIGIDDCLDFLSTYAAGLAIASRGGRDRANELLMEALGPAKTESVPDGMLLALLRTEIKRLQRIPPEERRRKAFRERVTNNTQFVIY